MNSLSPRHFLVLGAHAGQLAVFFVARFRHESKDASLVLHQPNRGRIHWRGTRCRVTRPDDPSPVAVHRLLWIVTPATTDLHRVVAGLRSTLVNSMRCMAAPCKLIGLRCV